MVDCIMLKGGNSQLMPSDDVAHDFLKKIKIGEAVKVKITRARNLKFHRKWFALAQFAYEYWETPEIEEYAEQKWKKKVTPEKNFDRFRKDLTILAGYYDAQFRINGDVRIVAKSLAFGSMSQEDFDKLYSATIDVVLKQIYKGGYSEDELRTMVDQAMAFA